MKVTIQHTEPKSQNNYALPPPVWDRFRPTVIIEVPDDDLTIDEMWTWVVRPALLGLGYGEKTLDRFFEGVKE